MEPPTILIVDDEKDVVTLAEKILKLEGFQTISCLNGIDALGIIEKEYKTISLILLDILMPGISGYDVAKKIKSVKEWAHIFIILFTAKAIDEDIYLGKLKDVDGYILKPFKLNTLIDVVRKVLNLY